MNVARRLKFIRERFGTVMSMQNVDATRRLVVARLESLQQAGVLQLPRSRRVIDSTGAESVSPENSGQTSNTEPAILPSTPMSASIPNVPGPAREPQVESGASRTSGWQPLGSGGLFDSSSVSAYPASSAATLQVLQTEVAGCTRCDELARTRTQTVFGVGKSDARLCFVGEAPGADEDRLGEPFVGRAGQLLTKIIEACRMKREDVYILNMIKCRPPGNRNPLPEELANCRSYLERQLALVRPEFVCCLGAVAGQNLLGTTLSIGKLRGKVHVCRGAKVVCTYHPAYLLRNPAAKKDTWEDMKLLMREMGVEL
jgi:DNA polymerase